ncbi:methyl-accepting chemotaxis protein [Clostridium uliginosum]|uniref:Methyl-accepting chemotaxis protein n=1 Tax=Clostridium uliginosum TaxID=119641 RepID=A0A1I1L729_9CLOT|nr:methyl-accepting chemotaxis protein [Clostridium uliginosum]SFC68821.1 Methyl-accepting chemotaxis protein [Clostridium uliginosum]
MFNSKNNTISKLVNDIYLLRETKDNFKIDNSTLEKVKSINIRLNNGKNSIQKITKLVLDSVIQMSSLDLILKDKEEKISNVSHEMAHLVKNISNASEISSSTSEEVTAAHTDMTQAIGKLSENSLVLLESTKKSELELVEIKDFSETAISHSKGMKEDMNNLLDVIRNIQGVINAINEISEQTNLLALNASIEAARAGESGKGFAVVAEEIRNLADETKTLTANMSSFVSAIEVASNKSNDSVDNTVESLENINNNLDSVVKTSKENRENINNITDAISMVAANSEEINSSMDEVSSSVKELEQDIDTLNNNTIMLEGISKDLHNIILPVSKMEGDLDKAIKVIGELLSDRYYMINNELFIDSVNKAITAHKNWLGTLKDIIISGEVIPLQVDDNKCGFGHFYYSMKPKNKEVLSVWINLEKKHKKFHEYGQEVIDQIENNNATDTIYSKVEKLSIELISDFTNIIKIVEKLESQNKNVYEE